MTWVGHRIRQARERADPPMSQASLARAVGVSRVSVSQWEKGETRNLRHENLLRVARVLGVSVQWLLSGEVAEPEAPYGPHGDTSSRTDGGGARADGPGGRPDDSPAGSGPGVQARDCAVVPVVSGAPRGELPGSADHAGRADPVGGVGLPVDDELARALSAEAFAFRMPDEAMAPHLHRDDWVIADPEALPEPGIWIAVCLPAAGGMPTVRRLHPRRRAADGTWEYALEPLDPTFAVAWTDERSGLAEVQGVVVEIRRRLARLELPS